MHHNLLSRVLLSYEAILFCGLNCWREADQSVLYKGEVVIVWIILMEFIMLCYPVREVMLTGNPDCYVSHKVASASVDAAVTH